MNVAPSLATYSATGPRSTTLPSLSLISNTRACSSTPGVRPSIRTLQVREYRACPMRIDGHARYSLTCNVPIEGVPRVPHEGRRATRVAVVVGRVGVLLVPPDGDPLPGRKILRLPHPDRHVVGHVLLLLRFGRLGDSARDQHAALHHPVENRTGARRGNEVAMQ